MKIEMLEIKNMPCYSAMDMITNGKSLAETMIYPGHSSFHIRFMEKSKIFTYEFEIKDGSEILSECLINGQPSEEGILPGRIVFWRKGNKVLGENLSLTKIDISEEVFLYLSIDRNTISEEAKLARDILVEEWNFLVGRDKSENLDKTLKNDHNRH